MLSCVLATLLLLALVAATTTRPAQAAPGEDDTPIENPDLPIACGIDIHVILDESGSVQNYTNNVKQAFRAFTSALKNTGSRMAVSEFSTVARLPLRAPATNNYTVVTDATITSTFEPYIATEYRPSGSTHWEDSMRVARYFLPRPSPVQPHLVVFITDGDPNKVVRENRVTYDPGDPDVADNEYELKVPLADDETADSDNNPAKDRTVSNANALKAIGSHILSIAVGAGLDKPSSLARIIDVSGPDVFDGTGVFDISGDDVYRVPNFDDLEDALREAAFQLCAPSITVRKLTDDTPDPGTDDAVPAEDWEMTATADPEPAAWVLPPGASGDTATSETDASGFVNFQWTTATPTASDVDIDETIQQGYENDESATACTYRTPDQGDRPLTITTRDGGFSATVPDDAIVTCRMVNRIPPDPSVTIEKATNGDDADDPPGPFVPIGEAVAWDYLVTNTGNVTLSQVEVSDDHAGVTVTCPSDSLPPDEEMLCTASGAATVVGLYTNVGTVNAQDPFGTPVTASDPSHYTGATAGIDVEKTTNGDDADDPPGPFVPIGDTVTWTYTVTNTGTVDVSGVTLDDDQPGVTPVLISGDDGDGVLQTTETWVYQASDPDADPGQYENLATVEGTALGETVGDSDASHYFGADAGIALEKFVNGADADAAPGVLVPVGGDVAWRYEFENTGNVPLRWSLSDLPDPGGLDCPRILIIAPGQVLECHASLAGGAQVGLRSNTATVDGTGPGGTAASDSDPANYFGVEGAIDIEKETNGVDADQPPGPAIAVGGPVTWTYEVTNEGNGPLTDVRVIDTRGVTVTCPQTTLAIAESITCVGDVGIAEADAYTNHALVTALTEVDTPVADADPSHYFGSTPGILLEKSTNGVDADDAPGVLIPVGQPVEWTYTVINTGNAPLTAVSVSDNRGVAVTCPQTTLALGEEMVCTGSGTAALGDYDNVGTARGTGIAGTVVTDDDPSHHFGFVSQISVEKFTNGEDADDPTGPNIPVGSPVTWTYQVTNPGNVYITDVALVDDKGVMPQFASGDADGDEELDPGEIWVYEATGTATAGQYVNVATVTGLDQLEQPVSDSDPSHFLSQTPPLPPTVTPPSAGAQPGDDTGGQLRPRLVLRKRAGSSRVRAGNTVSFKLRVRNIGRATARRVRVCDRLPSGLVWASARGAQVRGRLACFRVATLRPRASRTYTVRARAESTEIRRRICNVARRSARGARSRSTRACINLLPEFVRRGGGVTG